MRDLTAPTIATYPGVRTLGQKLTFRKQLPVFTEHALEDTLGLSDPSTFVDVCQVGTGIVRVCNHDDVLFKQTVTDMSGSWPNWVNTSVALYPGSRPGVENVGGVAMAWFQGVDGSVHSYRLSDNSDWHISDVGNNVAAFAPVGNGCYVQYMEGPWLAIAYVENGHSDKIWTGHIYSDIQTPLFLDAVRLNGVDYIFTMDRNSGRTLQITRAGDTWSSPIQVLPLDIVDNTSGFTLAYASIINGRIFVTGSLVRSNDGDPIRMDIFTVGPAPFAFGRYKLLSEYTVGGKLLAIGTTIHYIGLDRRYEGVSTDVFGNPDPSTIHDIVHAPSLMRFADSEGGGSQLQVGVHSMETIAKGYVVEASAIINDAEVLMGTYIVTEKTSQLTNQGTEQIFSGVGKSLAELERWTPFQSFYMASQVSISSHPGVLTEVIRATGLFSQTDGPLVNDQFNTPGVLYSVARASENTIARAKFKYPSSSVLLPRYGVGVNYAIETAYMTAQRLGLDEADITEVEYGANGIVALYSPAEASGASGIGLYLLTNNTYSLLASAPFSIPADQWHWLQITFIDGYLTVSYRQEGLWAWQVILTHKYHSADRSPWASDTLGRGFIYLSNSTGASATLGFSLEDMMIPVTSNAMFANNIIVSVDDEVISTGVKSPEFTPVESLAYEDSVFHKLEGYPGFGVPITGIDHVKPDNFYVGAAAVITAGPGAGRAFKVVGYDANGPLKWFPTGSYTNGDRWQDHINVPGYGNWLPGNTRIVYVDGDAASVFGTGSIMTICSGLTVLERGLNGSTAVAHPNGQISNYTAQKVMCDLFETFAGDKDITIEDAITRVFRSAGSADPEFAALIDDPTITAWGSVWGSGRRNVVADMVLDNTRVMGFAFRMGAAPTTYDDGGPVSTSGYMILSDVGNISLYIASETGWVLAERRVIPFTPTGTMRISVKDNVFSVWINNSLIHSFCDGTYTVGEVFGPVSPVAGPISCYVSELCEILPDLPIDTSSNGWSAITTLIGQRVIKFADTATGTVRCYLTRRACGDTPDILTGLIKKEGDTELSRVRTEGLKITEMIDFAAVREFGDLGDTEDATYANSLAETMHEAKRLQGLSVTEAGTATMTSTFFPAITAGDIWNFFIPDGIIAVQVTSVSSEISLSEDTLVCTMNIEGFYEPD